VWVKERATSRAIRKGKRENEKYIYRNGGCEESIYTNMD